MVDSIAGAGASQNVLQVKNNQAQKSGGDRAVDSSASISAPTDEVSLSSEALSRAEVDGIVAQTRAYLESDTEASLSNGQNLDELL